MELVKGCEIDKIGGQQARHFHNKLKVDISSIWTSRTCRLILIGSGYFSKRSWYTPDRVLSYSRAQEDGGKISSRMICFEDSYLRIRSPSNIHNCSKILMYPWAHPNQQ